MLQKPNFPGLRPRTLPKSLQRFPDTLADGEGAHRPCQESQPRSRPFGPCFYRVQPITELATLLMIDFKCRPI